MNRKAKNIYEGVRRSMEAFGSQLQISEHVQKQKAEILESYSLSLFRIFIDPQGPQSPPEPKIKLPEAFGRQSAS